MARGRACGARIESSKAGNYQKPGRAPGNPYGRSTTAPDFRPGNSPAEITQTEPGGFGYFGKHLIKSPGDKKVPGRIAGRPDPAKNRPYGRSPPGTVRQPFVTFLEGTSTKRPLKTRTTTIADTKLVLSNSFTHERDQISSVKREKD